MTIQIPQHILDKTRQLLDDYQITNKKQQLLIAFSGGKDSLLTNLLLKQLGYNILAVYIDMGFPGADHRTKNILETAKKYHLTVEIFNVTSPHMQSMLPKTLCDRINERLTILFKHQQQEHDGYTPCTHCYNVKFLVLQYLAELYHIEYIALGHHGTDAVVSLLKSALMYIDRWDYAHKTFTRSNFEQLILKVTELKHIESSDIMLRIAQLVEQNYAGTDEPPVKLSNLGDRQLKIIRPLFNIFEQDIKNIYTGTSIIFPSDGCEHEIKSRLTPREMIHHRLATTETSAKILPYLHAVITKNLAPDGTIKFDARNNRSQLLGSGYKCSRISNIKL